MKLFKSKLNNTGKPEPHSFTYILNLDEHNFTQVSRLQDGQGFDNLSEFGLFYVDDDNHVLEKRESRSEYLALRRELYSIFKSE
jgi:hypothetical protein